MDGRVDIGGTRADTGLQHGHVHEGSAHVDHDLRAGLADQRLDRVTVHRIDRVGWQNAVLFHRRLVVHACNDRIALWNACGSRYAVAQHVIICATFMRDDLRDATGTDDQHVLLRQFMYPFTATCGWFAKV